MTLKFKGSNEEFLTILNKEFRQEKKFEDNGGYQRYKFLYERTEYNIDFFTTGTIRIQPHNENLLTRIENALKDESFSNSLKSSKQEVFLVHGHDRDRRGSLENMLKDWNVQLFVIQEEDSQGKTIIEFLEGRIQERISSVGIVLLTPDDIGYSKKDGEDFKKPRARQNVILELGMILGALGREKCILLYEDTIELPSDLQGFIYIPFKETVTEVKDKLYQKLKGLKILE